MKLHFTRNEKAITEIETAAVNETISSSDGRAEHLIESDIFVRNREGLFKRIVYAVWAIIASYVVFFFIIEDWMGLSVQSLGAFVLTPMTLLLYRRGYKNAAKMLFAFSCSVIYIFLQSSMLGNNVGAEYYYIAMIALALLIFPADQKAAVAFNIILPVILWAVTEMYGYSFLPERLINTNVPSKVLTRLNYLGAFSITFALLFIYAKTIRELSNRIIISKARENENLKALADARSMFLATMSHELKNPLNGILGGSQFLLRAGLTSEHERFARLINDAGNNLLSMVNDILDFSKLEHGRVELKTESFHLYNFVKDLLLLYKETARQRGIQLNSSIDPDLPKWVKGDVSRLRQIAANFISNAIKFSPRGSEVFFEITCTTKTDSRVDMLLKVTDHGIGIKQAEQAQLFNMFTQANPSISRDYGGTGLGLAICKKLAELMGGTISIESEYNRGTTMSLAVSLDFEQAMQSRNAMGTENDNGLSSDFARRHPHRILVADDNYINQVVMRKMLEQLGYSCDCVSDGGAVIEAVSRAHDNGYTIIFLDILMPVISGVATAEKILEQSGHKAPMLVAVTANAFHDDIRQYMAAGFTDCIPKPVVINDIARILHHGYRSEKKAADD